MKKLVLLCAILLTGFTTVNAQKIETKRVFGSNMYMQNNAYLSGKQLLSIVKENQEAYNLMKSANSNKTWATILGGAGGFLVGYPIGTAIGGGEAKWELAGVGAVLILVAIPINNGYNKKSKKAVDIYNEGLSTTASSFNPTFDLNLRGNSIGITMSF
ncbi:MAG: hypothetical protein HWD85_11675 [Flavobacteriaceae bacterium]|nr:hypothetical protein [Flavobacteriaceae bacterium]